MENSVGCQCMDGYSVWSHNRFNVINIIISIICFDRCNRMFTYTDRTDICGDKCAMLDNMSSQMKLSPKNLPTGAKVQHLITILLYNQKI